jgi:hypothetical protein
MSKKINDIVIIGSGWYGCHIAKLLQTDYNVTMIEQKSEIFDNSSYYNQNRLHLGFHYSRDYNTRSLCKNNYEIFKKHYGDCIDDISNNYYMISKDSLLDYQTYENIFKYEAFDFNTINNDKFDNIYDKILITDEKVINSDKAKVHFNESLKNVKIIFNTRVKSYHKNNNKIIIETDKDIDISCDLLLDCTYNQLGLSKLNYKYELTISLLYKKIGKTDIGAITIMDGKFWSLYPREIEQNTYTLTDVEFTPAISSTYYNVINNSSLTDEEIVRIRSNMENKVYIYYKDFLKDFKYESYFLSKKTKKISGSDSRDITIEEIEKNVITVNCGKIYGIFDYEDYIVNYLGLDNTDNLTS